MRRRPVVGTGIACLALALLAMGTWLHAAETAEPAAPKNWVGQTLDKCCWGGDLRVRQVHFDEIPIIADPPGVTRNGQNHFFRIRTRLWGQWDPSENVTVKGRVVNEFREWLDPELMDDVPDVSNYEFPDELVVDKLYLQVRNLLDEKLDVKIGRQDLIYGTGKVMLEGTPKDGSRTIYMDAAKLTWKGIENTTIDVFGIYNESENDLSIENFGEGPPDKRDIIGYDKNFNDATESGFGVYVKNASCARMPLEGYYIMKDEDAWVTAGADGEVTVPGKEIHTIGARFMPKLADTVDANLEVAFQTGETDDDADTEGTMVDAVVNWHLPVCDTMKPCLGAGVYYLSGDDPDTTDQENWVPLWGRWPQYSELYIYSWDAERAGEWSNLMMPHLDLSLALTPKCKAKAMVALLEADENDGPGTGDERGVLGTLRFDFTLAEKLLTEKDKLMGHLLVEVLDPGDYYNVDETAHFARWELFYAF
ncbi:MAG: alginate export family protein [Phycisphaerae bacterium]|nr:alginate export family protein [Phycisphaerae bacterium]